MNDENAFEDSKAVFHSTSFASVAQLVEQLICNQLVGGSSPSTGSFMISRETFDHEVGGAPE